jgi:NADPH:quinone reductase-like Zn-dependent oxidoreductase
MCKITVLTAASVLALMVNARSLGVAQEAAQQTMKAIRVHEFGGPEVLKYEDVPIPAPAEGEMLVRVFAAGVNPVDAAIRQGRFGRRPVPFTPGFDVSGVVESVGEGVTKFKAGDAIFACQNLNRGGSYAQYTIVREDEAALKPQNLSHNEAAGVPLVALTAWQALFDKGELNEGQTVLIHAAAGGVGTMAVQLAKWKGARVIGTASASNHEFLKELGADEVIDYNTENFWEKVKDVDVVLDAIGGQTQDRSWEVLKPGGRLVSILQPPNQEKAKEHGVTAMVFLMQRNAEQLGQIAKLLEAGTLKAITTHEFPLADAAKAHEQIETKHTRGKIVLVVEK